MLQDRLVSLRHPHRDDYHRQGYDHPSSARDTALMAGSPTDTDRHGDDDDEAPTGNLTKLETSKHEHEHEALNNTPVVRPPPAPPAANKILFLDGLRGLAAMMVVVQHVAWMGVAVGQPAVDTFFVLSAFLLTMIFEKKARTLLAQKASYRRWMWALLDYFARRFLRVYPLFAFVAIYLTVYSPAQKEKLYFVHHPENYNVWKVLTFSFPSRYHVFWTLPLEITYYFIIPVFVLVILAFKRFWFLPIAALLVHVIYTGFYWYRGDHIPLKTHLPTFLCGSVFAIIYSKLDQWITAHSFEFKWWHKVLVRTLEFTSIAWMMSTVFNCLLLDWVMKDPFPSPPAGRFVSIHIAIMMVCEMLLPGALGSMLEWSLLRYAGKVSFSMYLLHSFVIYSDWIKRQGGWNHFFAIWGLVFLLSTVSYNLIEYPCQWLAGRVGAWIKKKDTEERERTAARLPTFDRSHEHV